MKLVTKEIEKKLPSLYTYDGKTKKEMLSTKVVAKYFHCMSRYIFYVLEGDIEKDIFFGYRISPLNVDFDEYGYTPISELKSFKNQYGVPMERDIFIEPMKYTLEECLSMDYVDKNTYALW